MKRILLITPACNLEALADAARAVEQEAGSGLAIDNILTYQISDGDLSLADLEERLESADVIVCDVRDAFGVVFQLRETARRYPDKTIIPLSTSALSVISLCRMGSFSMERALARVPLPMGLPSFRRIHQLTNFVEKLLVGALPIGPVAHARNWVRILCCWATGTPDSLETLLRIVTREYCDLSVRRGDQPPDRPAFAVQHPAEDWAYGAVSVYLKKHPLGRGLPNIALIYHGSIYREASAIAAAALVEALEGSANVVPIATDGVEGLEAVRELLFENEGPRWDALVDLTWYRLDGGPLGGSSEATHETLARLDVPVFAPLVMHGRELQRWQRGAEGPSAVEVYAAVAQPELDGALAGQALAAVERFFRDGRQVTRGSVIPGRPERVAKRILGWTKLRGLGPEQRKVGIVLPWPNEDEGQAGFDIHLDLSASLLALLGRLAAEGYDVGETLPSDPLGLLLSSGHDEKAAPEENSVVWLERENYALAFANLPESVRRAIEARFGPPPGHLHATAAGIALRGRWFGNVFCGLEPSRLPPNPSIDDVCEPLPPHHQYVAFYEYLHQRGVRACIHLGSRGTASLLPGKPAALSGDCFSDVLSHDVPQIHVCTVASPGGVTTFKRRFRSLTITHHAPDFCKAGLWGPYALLREKLDEAMDLSLVGEDRRAAAEAVLETGASLGLVCQSLSQLADQLSSLEHARIPLGLHVLGRPKSAVSLKSQVARMLERRLAGVEPAAIAKKMFGAEHVREGLAFWAEELVDTGTLPDILASRLPRHDAKALHDVLTGISNDYVLERELGAVVCALAGKYVTPGPTGDGMRSPAIYPTGRNAVAVDPSRIPMPEALERGGQVAAAFLKRFTQEQGKAPSGVAIALCGNQTARTGGESVGQVLHLVGAKMLEDPGWLPVFEALSDEELARPRCDVTLALCPQQRDLFPLLHRELDLLLRRVFGDGAPRLFAPAPGVYAPAVADAASHFLGSEDRIHEMFLSCLGYAYGSVGYGVAAADKLEQALSKVDLVCMIQDGEDIGLCEDAVRVELLGGLITAVTRSRGAIPKVYIADTSGASARIDSCAESLGRFVITRLLNPVWIDGMLEHPRHGAQQIEHRVGNVLSLCRLVDAPPWIPQAIMARLGQEKEMAQRLARNNPNAAKRLLRHLHRAVELQMTPNEPDSLERELSP
jgi:cobalamin biosynthesis Mg chelatase CobN